MKIKFRDGTEREVELKPAANLRGADLRGANLRGADLWGANLGSAESDDKTTWPDFQIPQGAKICGVWKKLRHGYAQLTIPWNARRTASLVGRKCRAEFVKVNKIVDFEGKPLTEAYDMHTGLLKYEVGKIVHPDSYDPDPKVECTSGIHFFLTKEEAERY